MKRKNTFFAVVMNSKMMMAVRTLLTAILLMTGLNGAQAYEWTGNTVAEGDYYLYNVAEGKFLSFGAQWGTRAVLVENAGELVTLSTSGDNYKLTFGTITQANKGVFLNGENLPYCDGTAAEFTFTETSSGSKTYYLSSGGRYLSAQDYSTKLTYPLVTVTDYAAAGAMGQWKLVTRADRIAALADARPDNPIDATFYIAGAEIDQYFNNNDAWDGTDPRFDGRTGGNEATGYAAENYWGESVKSYQTLSGLPAGKYSVSCFGFYRDGGVNDAYAAHEGGTEDIKAWLYANAEATPLSSIFVGAHDTNRDGDARLSGGTLDGKWVPNSMAGAVLSFYDGVYPRVSVDVDIAANENLEIGIEKGAGTAEKWTIWDTFRLTYYGDEDWEDLHEAIIAAEAHTLGFDDGEYAPYRNVAALEALAAAKTLYSTSSVGITKEQINTCLTALTSATWTPNVGEVNGVYNPTFSLSTNDGDMTGWQTDNAAGLGGAFHARAFVLNSGTGNYDNLAAFGQGDGTRSCGYFRFDGTNSARNTIYNYGSTTGYTIPLDGAYYVLKADVGGWGQVNKPITLEVVDEAGTVVASQTLTTPATGMNAGGDAVKFEILFKLESAGNYRVNLRNGNTGNDQAVVISNFYLYRATISDFPDYSGSQMNVDVKQAMLDAKAALEAYPVVDNQLAYAATIEDAEASIAIYQKIKTYFDNLSATQLGGIPLTTFQAADVYKKYSNGTLENTGTYTDLNSVVAEWRTFAANYWSTNTPAANADLTAFIVNQGFEMDKEAGIRVPAGWTLPWGPTNGKGNDYNTQEIGAEGSTYYIDKSEGTYLYNLWENYTNQKRLEQTMTGLPKGRYELTAYVAGFEGASTYLYGIGGASTETTTVPTTGAAIAHEVTVSGYVTDDAGTLTIRIENTGDASHATFFKVDNFHLIYKGNDFDGITLVTPTGQMNAGVKEAMLAAEAAHISSPTLPNLNARMAAYNTATASIAEYERINAYLTKLGTTNQLGSIPESSFNANAVKTKYSDGTVNSVADPTTGTYTSLNEVIPLYKTFVQNYWSTNTPTADANLTAFIVNQGFELGNTDAWAFNGGGDTGVKATSNGTYAITNSEGDNLFNTWNNKAETRYIEQTITNIPNGLYTIKAIVAGYNDASEMILRGTSMGYLADLKFANSEEPGVGTEQTLTDVPVGDGTLTIRMQNTGLGNSFFKLDNVRLIYQAADASSLSLPDSIKGIMRAAAFVEQYDAYTAWDGGNNTPAAFARAMAAYEAAESSHAAYLKAQAAINRVNALLGSTNVYTYEAYVKFHEIYDTYKTPFDQRTLEDNMAAQMEYQLFGNGTWRQKGVPVVTFLGSAWDHAGDNMWNDPANWLVGFDYNKDAAHNYWVNSWTPEGEDTGHSSFSQPFIEYWYANDQILADNTLTAIVKAVPESTTNKVTVKVLARISDGETLETPRGITLQVAAENAAGVIDDTKTVTATPAWEQVGDTRFYECTVTLDGATADYDRDGDGFGDLRIQFVIEGTNASWFAYKDAWVTYGSATVNWTAVRDSIAAAETKVLGFWGGEYAPYNNVQPLKAIKALRGYYADQENANSVLVNLAMRTLKVPGWQQNPGDDFGGANPRELNAVSWRTNYTKDEIIHTYDYDKETGKSISWDFQTIIPDGWDLNGRSDGYDTRLIKYGVNANTQNGQTGGDDPGLFACCDSLCVFTKRDSRYGDQLGYTMPLKPNTKYSLTFIYTNWAKDMAEAESFHENDTYIKVRRKDDPSVECQIYYTDTDDIPTNDEELDFVSQGAEGIDMGNRYAQNWKAVHAHFTTGPNIAPYVGNDEYVIEFNKEIKNRQIQIAIGELYILKYRDEVVLTIDGQNKTTGTAANNYTDNYKLDTLLRAGHIKLTRTLKKGQWNSLCLPIKIPYHEMREIFTVGGKPAIDKVYIFTGTTRSGYYEVLNFTSRQGGIQAGQPVLVKPYNDIDGEDVATDIVLDKKLLKNYVVKNVPPIQKDPARIYDFVGVYEVYSVQQNDVYTKFNSELGKDELVKKVTDDKKTWLQPTRAYFKDVSVESGRYDAPGQVKLWAFSIDDVETGIMAVEPDRTMTVTSGNIYDLNGRLVRQNATSLEGLRPGIYIVDGRKVMIR